MPDINIAVITACMFKDRAPIHFLDDSCKRFGIELHPYGVGTTYTDWPHIKITKMLEAFKQHHAAGRTHVLYTDGRDSFFLAGMNEIVQRYELAGAPGCFMAAEAQCYPRSHLSDKFPDPGHQFRWLGSGQFMGRLDYLIWAWEVLTERYMFKEGEDQNEQGWMVQEFADGGFGPEFKLDYGCEIFQSCGNGGEWGTTWAVECGTVRNKVTGSFPCAIHWNGGYSDPVTGKDEQIMPVWKELGFV